MYKNGFGINNLQYLMCHETKANQIVNIYIWNTRESFRNHMKYKKQITLSFYFGNQCDFPDVILGVLV